jgi:hypothetical protein
MDRRSSPWKSSSHGPPRARIGGARPAAQQVNFFDTVLEREQRGSGAGMGGGGARMGGGGAGMGGGGAGMGGGGVGMGY